MLDMTGIRVYREVDIMLLRFPKSVQREEYGLCCTKC